MKKKTLLILAVLITALACLFTSCSASVEPPKAEEEFGYVTFGNGGSRSLTTEYGIKSYDDLYWYYTAEKKDGFGLTGQSPKNDNNSFIPQPVNAIKNEEGNVIRVNQGLSGEVGPFSQGAWVFTLYAYESLNTDNTGNNLVYQGTSATIILKGGETKAVPVSVSLQGAKGKIDLSRAYFQWANNSTATGQIFVTVKLTNANGDLNPTILGPLSKTDDNGYQFGTTPLTVNGSADITADYYTCTINAYLASDVDSSNENTGATINTEATPVATQVMGLRVYGNATTYITGNLVESPNSYVDFTVPQQSMVAFNQNLASVPSNPANVKDNQNKALPTTIIFGSNLNSSATHILTLEVADIDTSSAKFTVENTKSAVASLSFDLKAIGTNGSGATTQTPVDTFTNPVTITTYIAKGLSGVQVKYNGEGDAPTLLDYESGTGKLVFSTTHFSEYYVVSNLVEALNVTTNTAYTTLADAINNASDGDTVVLLNNTSVLNTSNNVQEGNEVGNTCIVIDKGITIDGNGKIITLRADNAADKTYGIYITGNDKSKTVTIKNTTIKTTNLERAIRTYGNIGFKIENSTITTNGVGVHVKGSNKVDIINTKINVNVIDNSTFSAHRRAGVVVGGVDADVTVDRCTINAVNDKKTTDKNTLCKGLYVGAFSKNAKITANDTNVVADFSIAIDGAQYDHTPFEKKPTQIIINSGEYSGLVGSPGGYSYKSLFINGGTFTGISDFISFSSNDDVAKLVISGGTFNIEPDSKFIKDGYNVNEENGQFVVYEGTIVCTAEQLQNILTAYTASGAGDKVVSIANDLRLAEGEQWVPARVQGYTGAGVITVNGNGHTIYGLNAPLFAGGFAGDSGIIVNNLTIDGATIDDTYADQGLGAFICSIDSMPTIELNNCHLKNSTITSTGGARVGGLIGWSAGYNKPNDGPVDTYITITNCSDEQCEIAAKGSVGGIIGHAGGNPATFHRITGCTVNNTKLHSSDDGDWRVGVVVGTANVGEVTISGTTVSGNTTLTQIGKTAPEHSNLYGRFVPGDTGNLTIDGVEITN